MRAKLPVWMISVLVTSTASAYMPPPAETHWDGYGSAPYVPQPTQANQLNELGSKSSPPKNFDQNFNNDIFQTSHPDYNNYGSNSPDYDQKQFFYNGQYNYPNPTRWQYAPVNQPQTELPDSTSRPNPVFQNQIVPDQSKGQGSEEGADNQPSSYRLVPQTETTTPYLGLPSTYQTPPPGTPQ